MELLLKKHIEWIADEVDELIDTDGIIEMLDRPVTKGFLTIMVKFEEKASWVADDDKAAIHGMLDQLMDGNIAGAISTLEPIADKYINFKNVPDDVEAAAFNVIFSVINTVVASLIKKDKVIAETC